MLCNMKDEYHICVLKLKYLTFFGISLEYPFNLFEISSGISSGISLEYLRYLVGILLHPLGILLQSLWLRGAACSF